MTYNVFISHSSQDGNTARQFQTYLQNIQGVSVFLSETSLIIGQVDAALIKKIGECDLFLVLYSKNSHASNYVQHEIGVAKGSSKPIIPILLDSEAKPDAMLVGVNYLSLYDGAKWNEQLPRLYQHITVQSKTKSNNEAVGGLILAGLFLYALSKK